MLQVICLDITSVQEEQYNKLFEQRLKKERQRQIDFCIEKMQKDVF